MGIERQIYVLSIISTIARMACWIFIAWIGIEILIHIDNHGLKHLIDVIWLGDVK